MYIRELTLAIVLLPLAGAAAVGLVGLRWVRSHSHLLVLAGVGVALGASLRLFNAVRGLPATGEGGSHAASISIPIYQWVNSGDGPSWFNVSFRVDPLTSVMLLTVLSVSFLVVTYSVGYMRDHHGHPESGYERFFAFLGLFVFSMCTLVLAGNFLVLYLGWELVGLSSYLLIGFYYQKPEAALAARKAFVVNRVGDFGFGLGILLIYLTFGTLEYHQVFA